MNAPQRTVTGFAVEAAEGFRNAGLQSAPRRGKIVVSSIADLIAGSVNLSLAVELYLKACQMLHGIRPVWGHNLDDLFAAVPESSREQITREYIRLLKENPEKESDLTIQGFHSSPDPSELKAADFSRDSANPSVLDLLKEHRDLFMRLRYVHELPSDMRFSYFYDFRAMSAFCDAVRKVVQIMGGDSLITIHNGPPPDNWGE